MTLWLDINNAWRASIKNWGYSLMCGAVMALSLGLSVWTYAFVYSQLLKPLGFPDSERWYSVQIAANAKADAWPSVDAYTYQQMLKQNRSASYLGAFASRSVVLSEGQASARLRDMDISPRFLNATEAAPMLGRRFEESDGQPGGTPVAIISFDTWQNYFAADPTIIGKTARVDSGPVQIVGVMGKDFFLFQDAEIWMPLHLSNIARPRDSQVWVTPFIRVDNKDSLPSILSEMKAAVDNVNTDYPETFNAGRHADLYPALRAFTHGETPVVLMVAMMAVAVLLLGGVNISMVFLVRLLERSRELALRTALGASRYRLLRQCLLETVGVVAVGLLAGVALGVMALHWAKGIADFAVQTQAAGRYPNLGSLRPADLLIAASCAAAIWLLSTLIPAWRVTRQEAAQVLAGSGKGSTMTSSGRSVGILVGLQVAVAALVLVICGNMVLSIRKEVGKPKGMDTAAVMLSTYPTAFGPRYADAGSRLRYWSELMAAVESKLPGSEVAFTTSVPTRPAMLDASVEGQQGTHHEGKLRLPVSVVSDGYFKTLGLNLRSGRLFDSTDNAESLRVAVIDEKLAARYWPDQSALGKRVQLSAVEKTEENPWITIVGIVSAVGGAPYNSDSGVLYEPLRQVIPQEFQLLVKLPAAAADGRAALRAAAYSVDRDLPLHNLQMLDTYLASLIVGFTGLLPVFTAVALITAVLAASGLFGLISRSVIQRTQQVGIRRALGATKWQACSTFVRQGTVYLCVAIAGVGLGTLLLPPMSAAIPNILERVAPVTAGVIVLIAVVIVTASYFPTRRAVSLEPGDAVRYE